MPKLRISVHVIRSQLPATLLHGMNDTCIRCANEVANGLENTAVDTVTKIQYVLRPKDLAVRRGAKKNQFLDYLSCCGLRRK
jgi:hypothetical protein